MQLFSCNCDDIFKDLICDTALYSKGSCNSVSSLSMHNFYPAHLWTH